jgi:hypothetical protein
VSNLIPIGIDREALAHLLEEMAQVIREGDSFEGNFEYTMPEQLPEDFKNRDRWPSEDAEFWVRGVYRIGNINGQGGVRMIGQP